MGKFVSLEASEDDNVIHFTKICNFNLAVYYYLMYDFSKIKC